LNAVGYGNQYTDILYSSEAQPQAANQRTQMKDSNNSVNGVAKRKQSAAFFSLYLLLVQYPFSQLDESVSNWSTDEGFFLRIYGGDWAAYIKGALLDAAVRGRR
jgi:hypothetical protein